jgi:hypothetical protein
MPCCSQAIVVRTSDVGIDLFGAGIPQTPELRKCVEIVDAHLTGLEYKFSIDFRNVVRRRGGVCWRSIGKRHRQVALVEDEASEFGNRLENVFKYAQCSYPPFSGG